MKFYDESSTQRYVSYVIYKCLTSEYIFDLYSVEVLGDRKIFRKIRIVRIIQSAVI